MWQSILPMSTFEVAGKLHMWQLLLLCTLQRSYVARAISIWLSLVIEHWNKTVTNMVVQRWDRMYQAVYHSIGCQKAPNPSFHSG
jgi:hypothetical protein